MIDPHQIRPNRPRWTFALPYPGRMPQLSYHQWNVLGLLSVAGMFDAYDVGIMGLAISEIQTSLAIAEGDVGGLMAVIRLGMLPAFALTVMADRLGRRRLLLATIIGFTACTFLTAFARDAQEFMLLQFIGRIFIAGESMLAIVVIIEELNVGIIFWCLDLLGYSLKYIYLTVLITNFATYFLLNKIFSLNILWCIVVNLFPRNLPHHLACSTA